MKIAILIGSLVVAMTACGSQQVPTNSSGGYSNTSANADHRGDPNAPPGGWADGGRSPVTEPEKAVMTPAQQTIADAGAETKWDEQAISWKLPKRWKKIKVVERLFKYGQSEDTFIYATVLDLAPGFDSEASLKSAYDGAVAKVEAGEYEKVRVLEIDGVRGVEWIETMPSDPNGPRRHQWVAFRKHNGKTQQMNVILAAKGPDFDKHRDEFAAAMYSIKISK